MKVKVIEVKTNKAIEALIEISQFKDMPLKKDGWNFNWRTLYKVEGAEIYKLTKQSIKNKVEGVIMLSLMNDEMLYMNNLEVAPYNYGTNGEFDKIAGCLIAFGCLKSIELGQHNYKGYLTFESKTALIDLYRNKYGATLAMGQRMFIDPSAGKLLIDKYLDLKI